jgi:hypothetical protein
MTEGGGGGGGNEGRGRRRRRRLRKGGEALGRGGGRGNKTGREDGEWGVGGTRGRDLRNPLSSENPRREATPPVDAPISHVVALARAPRFFLHCLSRVVVRLERKERKGKLLFLFFPFLFFLLFPSNGNGDFPAGEEVPWKWDLIPRVFFYPDKPLQVNPA